MSEDKELQRLLEKKALQAWQESLLRRREALSAVKKEESRQDIVRRIRSIVEGARADEIIDKAVRYYGDDAIRVFKKIIELYERGEISKLADYELYEILQRLGMKIPLETKIRIVRHGSEKSFSEVLSE